MAEPLLKKGMSLLAITALALFGATAVNAQNTWTYSANTISHPDGWKLQVQVLDAQLKTLSITGCVGGPPSGTANMKPLNLADPISEGYTIVSVIGQNSTQPANGGVLGTYANRANSLILPETLVTIGENAFYRCRAFSGDLTIPDSVVSIGFQAFRECDGFTGALNLGYSLTTIGRGAFRQCNKFTEPLWVPDAVTFIDALAFQDTVFPRVSINSTGLTLGNNRIFGGNTALVMVYFRGAYPAVVGSTAFSAGANDNPNLTIYVLPEYVDDWNVKGLKDGLLINGPITATTTTAVWPQQGNGNDAGNPTRIGSWEEEVYFFNDSQWLHVDEIKMLPGDNVDLAWETAQITLSGSYRYIVYASTDLSVHYTSWEPKREVDAPPELQFFRALGPSPRHGVQMYCGNSAIVPASAPTSSSAPNMMFFKVKAVK
jgi:hypothetical protein